MDIEIEKAVSKINVLDQSEISTLKKKFTGQGVGILVGQKLSSMVVSGEIKSKDQLPDEFSKLGLVLFG